VSDAIANNIIQGAAAGGRMMPANPVDRLSHRELQVLHRIGAGTSTREIARSLNLSIKTIESHRQRIKRKLNLRNGMHLMRFAVDWFNCKHAEAMPNISADAMTVAPQADELF
jgi:DNA-binding NarL/FixJ family response regulator